MAENFKWPPNPGVVEASKWPPNPGVVETFKWTPDLGEVGGFVWATNPGCCLGALAASVLATLFIVGSVICLLNRNGKKKKRKEI